MFEWLSGAAASIKTTFTDAVCPECPIVTCPTLSEQLWELVIELGTSTQECISQVPTYAYIAGGAAVASLVYYFARNTDDKKAESKAWPISYDEITPVTRERKTRQADIRDYFQATNQSHITDYFKRIS